MSSADVTDEAEEELPSTEVPTTESPYGGTVSPSATSAAASSSSEKKSDTGSAGGEEEEEGGEEDTSTSPEENPTSTPEETPSSSPDADEDEGGDDGGGEDGDDDPPPSKPKRKRSAAPRGPPREKTEADVEAAGDISMQYEKKFRQILSKRRKAEEQAEAKRKKDKPDINELNAYYKAWVLGDFERQQENMPEKEDPRKKKKQEEIRLQKAQEAFCTWLQYKKQQIRMEMRCYRLRQKERRQLVRKRSRAESETAYQQWLCDKRRERALESFSNTSHRGMINPPVVYIRDMSSLYAKSYANTIGKRRTQSASGSCGGRRRNDDFYDVENVYCPEHKTEYKLETKRTTGGSCYRLTSVRKLQNCY